MIRGVYRAAAAMLTGLLRQDIHASNLANAETVGFKRSLARAAAAGEGQGNPWIVSGIDLSPGDLRMTEAPLDVALRSRGYFVVDTGSGRQYTRDGHFTLDAQGMLVNGQGHRVLGLRGPMRLEGSRTEIADDGSVYSDGLFVDKLLIVDFPTQAEINREAGSGVVADRSPAQVARYTVVQGALEASNVNAIEELTAMQSGFRIYEANAAAVSQLDRTLGKLIEAATG